MIENASPRRRIVSLDQFRGYTVVGMLFVNFLGGFVVVPAVFKHHNTYCSYADTIMPQFFFAVGFAYRLTFLRRLQTGGVWPAVHAVLSRSLALFLLGFVIYHLDGSVHTWSELQRLGISGVLDRAFKREIFQTLVQIAMTSDLGSARHRSGQGDPGRVLDRVGRALLVAFVVVLPRLAWNLPVIDGGWLGILTWTIPTLVGSLAYDAVANSQDDRKTLRKLLALVDRFDGRGDTCSRAVEVTWRRRPL